MSDKACTKCGELRPLDMYAGTSSGGKKYKRADCNDCRKKVHSRYFDENRDKMLLYRQEHYRKNKAAYQSQSNSYYARKRGASDGTVDTKFIVGLLKRQNFECSLCQCDISGGYEIDHVHPLYLGGMHTISNIQLLCRSCNRKKGYRIDYCPGSATC